MLGESGVVGVRGLTMPELQIPQDAKCYAKHHHLGSCTPRCWSPEFRASQRAMFERAAAEGLVTLRVDERENGVKLFDENGTFMGTGTEVQKEAQKQAYGLSNQAMVLCRAISTTPKDQLVKNLDTMAKTLAALRIAALAVLCFALAGCNFNTLNVFDVCLASGAALVINVTNSTDATVAQKDAVFAWDQTLVAGVDQACADIAQGGTAARIGVEVTADMALAVAQGQQLVGLPKDLAVVVATTMVTVEAILKAYQVTAVATAHTIGGAQAQLSAKDWEHLSEIRAFAGVLAADLRMAQGKVR